VRHYTIEIGDDGLVFNYAIDASWQHPIGDPPWVVPDNFGPAANSPEAWNLITTINDNTLWNDGVDSGGDLSLELHVWDHFNAGSNSLTIESPGNFDAVYAPVPIGGGEGYSTYEIEINGATPAPTSIDLVITVESEVIGYQGILPVENVSAYFVVPMQVYDSPPPPPNPGKVAWTSDKDGNPEIYTMVGDGTAQTRLTFFPDHDWEAAWSPDGDEIAWRRGGYGDANIWVMDEDGNNQHQVTTNGWNFDPDWDPDSEWIYFWSYHGEGDGIHLWKVRPNGDDQQQVSFFDESTVAAPEVSPNNDLVAYEGPGPGGGPRDLWVCNIDGTNPLHLTETSTWESYPHWNSDGTKISFCGEVTPNNFVVFIINPDGTEMEQVSVPPLGNDDFSACFGYNDEELIISRRIGNHPDHDEIIRYYIATDTYDQLTDNDSLDWYPDWHPADNDQ
jgi:TolB protein